MEKSEAHVGMDDAAGAASGATPASYAGITSATTSATVASTTATVASATETTSAAGTTASAISATGTTTSDIITIGEDGYPRTAVLDNGGRILSSTFGKQGESFLHHWFRRVKPTIDGLRAIDREYADA